MAQTYNSMGEVFCAQGRHAEALEYYYERSLAITHEVLGERHPDIAQTTTWPLSFFFMIRRASTLRR